jgi:hypothetical protein
MRTPVPSAGWPSRRRVIPRSRRPRDAPTLAHVDDSMTVLRSSSSLSRAKAVLMRSCASRRTAGSRTTPAWWHWLIAQAPRLSARRQLTHAPYGPAATEAPVPAGGDRG